MIRFKLDDNFAIEVSPEIVSKRLKSLIEEKGLSYTELEDMTGIPRATIQRYAAGKTDKIPTDRLIKIALKTHTSIFYLLGQDVPMEEEPALNTADLINKYKIVKSEIADDELRELINKMDNVTIDRLKAYAKFLVKESEDSKRNARIQGRTEEDVVR